MTEEIQTKIERKLDKRARDSKKFIAHLIAEIILGALLAGCVHASADPWVQRILAGSIGVVAVGYVLGTAALEAILGKLLAAAPAIRGTRTADGL